jgi:hypothetical protein
MLPIAILMSIPFFSGVLGSIVAFFYLIGFLYFSYKYIKNKQSKYNPLPIFGKILLGFARIVFSFARQV